LMNAATPPPPTGPYPDPSRPTSRTPRPGHFAAASSPSRVCRGAPAPVHRPGRWPPRAYCSCPPRCVPLARLPPHSQLGRLGRPRRCTRCPGQRQVSSRRLCGRSRARAGSERGVSGATPRRRPDVTHTVAMPATIDAQLGGLPTRFRRCR
jgi:hypothetical protein